MPVPSTNERAVANRRLLRDDVYERLLAAITDGTLEPGERLRDEELAGWLGVSRTPIREAITRLVDMGLIEMEPNRYTRVAVIDLDRFVDTHRVAASLYRLAAELAVPHLTDPELKRLQLTIRDARRTTRSTASLEGTNDCWSIYSAIVELSNNAVLVRAVNDLGPDIRRVSRHIWQFVDTDLVGAMLDELLAVITERDGVTAGQLLETRTQAVAVQMATAADAAWRERTQPVGRRRT